MRMTRTHRVVSALLIVPFFTASTVTASAQAIAAQPAAQIQSVAPGAAEAGDTMPAGLLAGEMAAESARTGGKLATGLAVGALTGLLGTGIGYFTIGSEDMPPEVYRRFAEGSPDYQLGFKTGWDRKTKSKKRNAFLAGGLLGTATFVAILMTVRDGGY